MKIVEYKLLSKFSNEHLLDLEELINYWINKGYQPYGYLIIDNLNNIFQAMVRYED